MGTRLLDPELVLGAADDDLALVGDVGGQHLAQRKRPWHAVHERDRVDAEGRLHRGVLVKLVEHDLWNYVALELDYEPHSVAVRLVAQVGDVGNLLLVDERRDLLNQAALAALFDHVRQFGYDDRLFALRQRLNVRLGLHADAATAGLVGVADPLNAKNCAAGREIGAFDVLHQAVERDVGVVDQRDRRGDHLTKVVRRNVRRHADSDSRGAVDEQVRVARRHHRWLLRAAVVVGYEVDRVHVEVAQHLGRQARHSRLGVPHSGGRVVVDRAEVPLAVD